MDTIPICSPSAPIRRTSRAVIFSLIGGRCAALLSCLISRLIFIAPNSGGLVVQRRGQETRRTRQWSSYPDLYPPACARPQCAIQLPGRRLPADREFYVKCARGF